MANFLILTDNPKRHAKFISFLVEEGHAHHVASVLKAAESVVDTRPPDAVLLDAEGLPILQALATARPLRGAQIVLLVTPERLDTFQLPTEVSDFLLTSALPAELRARIRCILRRGHKHDARKSIAVGDLEIDPDRYVVSLNGEPVPLTLKEFELLRYLATNRGRVFTREALLKEIWSYDYFGGARTVDVHVRRLRSKIEPDPSTPLITTVRGVGYKIE